MLAVVKEVHFQAGDDNIRILLPSLYLPHDATEDPPSYIQGRRVGGATGATAPGMASFSKRY